LNTAIKKSVQGKGGNLNATIQSKGGNLNTIKKSVQGKRGNLNTTINKSVQGKGGNNINLYMQPYKNQYLCNQCLSLLT
jgi:hypothetical protein